VLGKNIISYTTVGKHVRTFVLSTKETSIPVVPNRRVISVLTTASPLCSQEEPFLSVPQIAKKVTMSISTVHCHLTQTMRRKLDRLKRVPHSRTESETRKRVQRATKLMELLQLVRHRGCHKIVTLDESWLY
jgi:hypothetical protein